MSEGWKAGLGGAALAIVIVGSVAGACLYANMKENDALAVRTVTFETGIREGRPARVTVTETWQMPILSKYGYVPDERFYFSVWGGPHGCYVLPAPSAVKNG